MLIKCNYSNLDIDANFLRSVLPRNKDIISYYENNMMVKDNEVYDHYLKSGKHIMFLKKWILSSGIRCKLSNKIIPLDKICTKNLYYPLYFSDIESKIAKSHNKGKKRPDFAKKISKILKGRKKSTEVKKCYLTD